MKFNLKFVKASKYDYDILWFVAQDLEHIQTLHSKTNEKVIINSLQKSLNDSNLYSKATYTTYRKILNFFKINIETKREIINNKIIYSEKHNYISTTIINEHTIIKNNNCYDLIDNIQIDCPFIIYLFSPIIKFLINNHLSSQFKEDEIFRKRLQIIKDKIGLKKYKFLDKTENKFI